MEEMEVEVRAEVTPRLAREVEGRMLVEQRLLS